MPTAIYRLGRHFPPQTGRGIALAPADLVRGSLPLASWIRTDRVVTLNAGLIVKEFGRVSEAAIAAAVSRLCAFVGHGLSQDANHEGRILRRELESRKMPANALALRTPSGRIADILGKFAPNEAANAVFHLLRRVEASVTEGPNEEHAAGMAARGLVHGLSSMILDGLVSAINAKDLAKEVLVGTREPPIDRYCPATSTAHRDLRSRCVSHDRGPCGRQPDASDFAPRGRSRMTAGP